MMDVGSWLRGLGLERYEAAFRENEIDETILPTLTANDWKDLGGGIVGHRRKLFDAIAARRADATRRSSATVAIPHARGPARFPDPDATRTLLDRGAQQPLVLIALPWRRSRAIGEDAGTDDEIVGSGLPGFDERMISKIRYRVT
jgi:SAM domain (Sterile alpha motif)